MRGAWAELHGASEKVLEATLRVKHPKPWFSTAYRQKRWDGYVKFYQGMRFPAGLTERVVEHLTDLGRDVFVSGFDNSKPPDLSMVDAEYLPPVGKLERLYDHQLEALLAILNVRRGVVKAPTGSGKTEVIAAVAKFFWEEYGWRTLILVPKKSLMHQHRERLELYYDGSISVGVAGDGERIEGNVVIATGQTLQGWKPRRVKVKGHRAKQLKPADSWLRGLVKHYEVIIGDECHRASSDTWYEIFMESGARRRYGFSGTPVKDSELDDLKLLAATGPIVCDVRAPGLIEKQLSAKPKIVMVMAPETSGPSIEAEVEEIHAAEAEANEKLPRSQRKKRLRSKYQHAYRLGVILNEHHNRAVIRAVKWLTDRKRKTLLLCRYVEHLNILIELLEESGVNYVAVQGSTDKSDRDHAKRALIEGRADLAVATGIWDEGEDIPGVDAMVLAEGVAVSTNSRQRIGRGMRRDSEDVWVVDFVPTCHRTLREHAAKRAEAYEGEGYEVLVQTDWPKAGKMLLPFETWDDHFVEV